jgi:hypothetical protein
VLIRFRWFYEKGNIAHKASAWQARKTGWNRCSNLTHYPRADEIVPPQGRLAYFAGYVHEVSMPLVIQSESLKEGSMSRTGLIIAAVSFMVLAFIGYLMTR